MAKSFTVDSGGTLTTSLVAYYALSDVSDSKGSNTLTNNGSSAFSTGKYLNAVDFGDTNTTEYLNTTTSPLAGLAADYPYSFSFWMNVTTAPSGSAWQIIENQENTRFIATGVEYIESSGLKLRWRRDKPGVAGASYSAAHTLTVGTWYHIVLTYDGATLQGYLNGAASGAGLGTTGSGNTGTEGFNIGSDTNIADSGAANFPGLVDEVAIWSKVLSSTEISDLYNAGTGSFYVESGAAFTPRVMMF